MLYIVSRAYVLCTLKAYEFYILYIISKIYDNINLPLFILYDAFYKHSIRKILKEDYRYKIAPRNQNISMPERSGVISVVSVISSGSRAK